MTHVSVLGKSLEVRWHGPSPDRAPTLVFLHEGLGSAEQWRDFPARLADGLGMGAMVYSRAGYGRSDSIEVPRPLTYMQDEGERVLPAMLEATGVRRATLVGHSDGASIAIVYAGSPVSRGRLDALVLEAPHVFCEDLGVASIAAAREAYVSGDLRAKLSKYHDDVDAAFFGWNRAWLDPKFREWSIERYLPSVTVRTLVIQGEDDAYGTLAQVEAIERDVRIAKRVVFPKCGHAPHRELPEQTLTAMLAFLKRPET